MAYKHEHGGHRERMKDKYIKFGLEIFEPHEVLEMILFYAVPRVDTNPLAHRLIDHFGSLAGVFDASISQLMDFGLSKNAAVFISMIPKISRIYIDDKR